MILIKSLESGSLRVASCQKTALFGDTLPSICRSTHFKDYFPAYPKRMAMLRGSAESPQISMTSISMAWPVALQKIHENLIFQCLKLPKIHQKTVFFQCFNNFITNWVSIFWTRCREAKNLSGFLSRDGTAMVIRRGQSEEIEVFSWETSCGDWNCWENEWK